VNISTDKSVAGQSPTWVRWRIVVLLMALSFVSWFNRVNLPAAYTEQIQKQSQISEEQIGTVYSAFLLVYAVLMTPGGWFTDRFGFRLSLGLMGIGLGVFAALTGATGMLFSGGLLLLIALLVIRSMMGAFAVPMYPAGSRAVAHWIPILQRGTANGLVQGAAALGMATTPLVFGLLMDWWDWKVAFLITGLVTAAVGAIWLADARNWPWQHPGVNEAELQVIEEGSPETARGKDSPPLDESLASSKTGSWRNLLRNRSLVLLTCSYAAVGYFEYLFFFWMQYYFNSVLKIGTEKSREYSTIILLAMTAGMWIGGWLSDFLVRRWGLRAGRCLVPVGGMLAGAVLLIVGIQAEDPNWIVTWFALALACIGATEAPQWTISVALGGRRGAMAAGIFNTGGNLGGMLAPVVTPWVKEGLGWSWAIALGSIVCLIGACLWLWIDPQERVAEG
jgi:sugar phosphate permease